MMAENDPIIGGDIILAVIAGNGRRDIPVVQHKNLCCDERSVIAIRQNKTT
jgi:hypothetical protein